MVSLETAVKRTVQYTARPVWDPSTLLKMRAGCAHRRALEALRADDREQRALVTSIIAMESPTLYS
jgi:hypothetical protein